MAYLGMPLLFASLGYLLLYIVGQPIIRPLAETVQSFTSDVDLDAPSVNLMEQKTVPDDPNVETLNASDLTFPTVGDLYAKISIDGVEGSEDVYFGDFDAQLRAGIGQFNGSNFPGCGGTVLLSGHNNGYFHGLQNVDVGTRITLETNYGTYIYETEKTAVLNVNDPDAVDLASPEDMLVLYTCYPFDMLGLTPNRFFVYAKPVSGPKILLNQ